MGFKPDTRKPEGLTEGRESSESRLHASDEPVKPRRNSCQPGSLSMQVGLVGTAGGDTCGD